MEAAGKDSRWRSESDLKERDQATESSPGPLSRYSPGAASSSSSHASRRHSPPPPAAGQLMMMETRLRMGSDPSIARPDPSGRLQPGPDTDKHGKGLVAKLSPRLGTLLVTTNFTVKYANI